MNQQISKSGQESTMNNIEQTSQAEKTATLASNLVLISSILNNFNTAKRDDIFLIAGIIGLLSNFLSNKAAFQEANEQQIAPGVTTFANELKIIGSSIGLVAGIILFWALAIEISLRAQGIQAPITPSSGGASGLSGALLI